MLAGAAALVVGNTGPAHLAAAVGVPVVSLFAPTVPFGQWGPYRVPSVRLGDADAPCRDTRADRLPGARTPLPGRASTPARSWTRYACSAYPRLPAGRSAAPRALRRR